MFTASSDVINWDEAMQQVGDDEEFLRELLADLRSETESQLGIIAAIIQVSRMLLSIDASHLHFVCFDCSLELPNNCHLNIFLPFESCHRVTESV